MPESLEKLLDGLTQKISSVQSAFDEYQNECFEQRTPQFFCLELNGEAGELANIEKKSWKGKDIPIDRFEDEAADVFIALMNYANAKNISLGKAIFNKLNTIEQNRKNFLEKGEKY